MFLILESGQLYAWGCNEFGQLGLGIPPTPQGVLKPLLVPTSAKVSKVACGETFTVVLMNNGQVFTCGKQTPCLGRVPNDNYKLCQVPELSSGIFFKYNDRIK